MKKRILSFALVLSLLFSLCPVFETGVFAAETVTEGLLYSKHPSYLSNSDIDEATAKAESACYKVLNSYSKTDQGIAAVMTAMSDGISIFIRERLSDFGLADSQYNVYLESAAKKYVNTYLSNSSALEKATKKVNKAYKGIKSSYSVASSVTKEMMLTDLRKLATENDIHISGDGMDKVVNKLYGSDQFKNDLAAVGEAMDLWQAVLEMTELSAIEFSTMDILMDELEKAGQGTSDLYHGLQMLQADIDKDPAEYVLKVYGTKKVLSYLSKNIEKFLYGLTDSPASTIALVKACASFFANYVYADAKADKIIQSTMHMSFINSIDVCLSQYRLKFVQGKGTADDIETYKTLFGCSMAAYSAACSSCADCAKLNDKFSLGGDCQIWADDFSCYYNYDNYIKWCIASVNHDIQQGDVNSQSGEVTITDALNEETIRARLEKMYSYYTPNADKIWNRNYENATGSMGFAALVFNRVFDKRLITKVDNRYKYILTNDSNVRLIGRLEEGNVTTDGLKGIFANARIGDVVIASGKDEYLHAMTLTEVKDNAIEVYDCDSKVYKSDAKPYEMRKYDFKYSDMATAFNSHGKYNDKAGISIYRAIKKVTPTNSGTSLYYGEEYDDSVNYVIENGVLKAYNGSRSTIEIPDGVTEIAANCFKNKTFIKYVYMPDTITKIGNSAFYGCTNLRYIDLSSGITGIEGQTFYNCSSLGSIIIPDSVVYIGRADSYANNHDTFYGCTALRGIDIPDSVTEIGGWAFFGCTNLSSLKLSKNLEKIGRRAFQNCTSLQSLHIPKSLSDVQYDDDYNEGAFAYTGLTNITFEEGITKIPNNLFVRCQMLESITIPEGVTEIGGSAFELCTSLRQISLPDTLVYIGRADNYANNHNTFYGCTALRGIDIPDSVTEIGGWAFLGCTNLSSLKLSKNLEKIGRRAFQNCTSLQSLHIPKSLSDVQYDDYYNEGAFAYTGLTNITFEEGITKIPNNLFVRCQMLESITIPEGVTEIGGSAFELCTSLSNVQLNDNLTKIETDAFYGCSSLENIILPLSLTTINLRAFKNCTSLNEIFIPNSVTSMGTNVFSSCTSLEKAQLPENYNNIPESTFYNCSNLTEVEIPEAVTRINDSAFCGCAKLASVTIPENVTSIGNYAFYECKALTEITIPKAVTSIGSYAFENCDALQTATVNSSGSIGSRAFYDCDALTDLTISDKVTSIGSSMCYGCYNLKNVKLGRGITQIPDSSFRLCASLEEITLPRNLKTVASNAFAEDTKLTKAYIPASVTSIQNNSFSYPAKMAIYGRSGSYAETYANSRNIAFNPVVQPITTIAYTSDNIKIARYDTVMPEMQIMPDFDTDIINYISDNTSVATVSETGAIYGKAYGTAKISALTESGLLTTLTVTVVKHATSITLNKNSLKISEGKNETLTSTLSPTDSTDIVEWSSDNSSVAVVDSTGKVTGVKKGTATITAKAVYGNRTATCSVMVVDSGEPIVNVTVSSGGQVTISGENIPNFADIFVASYNSAGKLLEIKNVINSGAILQTDISMSGVKTIKAFLWDKNMRPLCESFIVNK